MVFAAPHMTMTRLTFAVVSSVYLAIAIPFEERALVDAFGAEYREYQSTVRWRMIPGHLLTRPVTRSSTLRRGGVRLAAGRRVLSDFARQSQPSA